VPPIWTAELIVDPRLAKELVDTQFPELSPASVRLLAAGWDNTAYVVNESFVFRFPRRSIAVSLIETEQRLLPWLAPRLPMSAPVPRFEGRPSDAFGWPFLGYPLIAGRTIAAARLSREDRAALAAPLATFFATLHAIPSFEAAARGVPGDTLNRLDTTARLAATDQRLRTLVDSGVLTGRRSIDEALASAPVIRQPRTDVLVHGDPHAGQILVDDRHRMSGVIDWGDVHLGDPAIDFTAAHTILPPEACEVFRRTYGSIDELVWQAARGRAIWHTVALLASAVDMGNREMVDETRQALARLVNE
jgi:aminoglycoside phosphotransferase (APT) family kinase protein